LATKLYIKHFIYKPIVRNRVEKMKFTQAKNRLFWKWLGT